MSFDIYIFSNVTYFSSRFVRLQRKIEDGFEVVAKPEGIMPKQNGTGQSGFKQCGSIFTVYIDRASFFSCYVHKSIVLLVFLYDLTMWNVSFRHPPTRTWQAQRR